MSSVITGEDFIPAKRHFGCIERKCFQALITFWHRQSCSNIPKPLTHCYQLQLVTEHTVPRSHPPTASTGAQRLMSSLNQEIKGDSEPAVIYIYRYIYIKVVVWRYRNKTASCLWVVFLVTEVKGLSCDVACEHSTKPHHWHHWQCSAETPLVLAFMQMLYLLVYH